MGTRDITTTIIFICMWVIALIAAMQVVAEALQTRTVVEERHIFVYVFDEKNEMWQRATIDELKHASCEHIRTYSRDEEMRTAQ